MRYWSILRRHRHPIKFVLSQLLIKSSLSRLLTIKQNDFVLKFYPTSFSANLWITPEMRKEDDEFIHAILCSGDIVVDVGANIGTTVLAASRAVGPEGKIYAFEAHPRTFKYLRGNVALNGAENIQSFNLAIGDIATTAFISDTRRDDMNSLVKYDSGIEVAVETLDHVLPRDERVALLKIDVEGYEKFVLEGAEELLKRTEYVYFEVYEKHFAEYGYRCRDIVALLEEQGFAVFRLTNCGEIFLSPVSNDYTAVECANLLAAKSIDGLLRNVSFSLQLG